MGNTFQSFSSGVGSGLKNYLTAIGTNTGNGDFESGPSSGVPTGWSLFNTTLTSLIPTGSIVAGASSLTTATATTSSPLAGNISFKVGNSSGTITTGHGFISNAFTIDSEDYAKVLGFSFYYKVNTGPTLLNMSGTSSNTWAVYIYDVTNSAWIQPAGVYGMNQVSGAGKCQGTFQTTAASTQYRIALICINANSSGATDILFDDFFVGPQTLLYGSPVTDWQSYTPTYTGFGSVVTTDMWYRRVGDSVEVLGRFTAATATATEARVSIPSGLTIDATKVATGRVVGYFASSTAPSTTSDQHLVGAGGNNYVTFSWENSGSGVGNLNANAITSTGVVHIKFIVPVTGWSSTVQMSNDTDTRVVAMRASGTATSVTSGAGNTTLIYPNVTYDTHGGYAAGSGVYTVSVPGKYLIKAAVGASAQISASGVDTRIVLSIIKGSSTTVSFKRQAAFSTSAITHQVDVSDMIDLVSGDTIKVQLDNNLGSTFTGAGSDTNCFFEISRISGPSAIAATETVFARCYQSSGQTITHNTTPAILNFDTKETDTHGAVTTGASWKFTAPVSGIYRVETSNALSSSTANQLSQYVFKNGSQFAQISEMSATGGGISSGQISGSTTMKLLAGDYIDIRFYQYDNGAVNKNTTGSHDYNHISITRIGN